MPAEMEKDARMRTENAGRDGLDAKTMSAGLLAAVCIGHFLNDGIGSIIPAALPILRDAHGLTFAEVGLITLVVQITSSLLQPLVGFATDKRPTRFALSIGMCFTFAGLILLGTAASLTTILLSVALIGCGSAVFHPESARIAQHASGGRKASRRPSFKSAAMQAWPSDRSRPLLWSYPTGNRALLGLRLRRPSPPVSSSGSAGGASRIA